MTVIREIGKIVLLFILIIIGTILYSIKEPIQVKAQKKPPLELTKEERDEYMEYLRKLSDDYVHPVYLNEVP
tara:strand:+ start:284 stop:499 length:216 start_codon:yes stop_codon:yes gene_type:complete